MTSIRDYLSFCLPHATLQFTLAMPIALFGALKNEPTLALSTSSADKMLSLGTLVNAMGKLGNGLVIDSIGARSFLAIDLACAAAASLAFGAGSGPRQIGVAYLALAWCASGGWLAACKIIEDRFQRHLWSSCFAILGIASRIASALSKVGLGAALLELPWRRVAALTAVVAAGSWVVVTLALLPTTGLDSSPNHSSIDSSIEYGDETLLGDQDGRFSVEVSASKALILVDEERAGGCVVRHADGERTGECGSVAPYPQESRKAEASNASSMTGRFAAFRALLCERRMLLNIGVLAGATCVAGALESMAPLIFSDLTALDPAHVAMVAASFPLGLLISMLLAAPLHNRLRGERKVVCELTLQMLSLSALAALLLMAMAARRGNGQHATSPSLVAACLFLAAFGAGVSFYVTPNVFALEVGGAQDCATASAILDCGGLLASMSFQLGASELFWEESEDGANGPAGWAKVFAVLLALWLLTSLCTYLLSTAWAKEQGSGNGRDKKERLC